MYLLQPRSEGGTPRIDDRDWSKLTLGQRIQHLEVEGYVVVPDLLDADHIARLKAQTSQFETTHVDYSVHQRGRSSIQFAGGPVSELISYPPMIEFLKELCGDQIVLMSYDYSRSEPGHPGISLHCDGQPWGSRIFSAEYTCPKIIRVLYYLDDLIPEVSPFRVVPRSHLSYHDQANPYLRYAEHPEEMMVTCKAGAAVLFNNYVFPRQLPKRRDLPTRGAAALLPTDVWAGPAGRSGALGSRMKLPNSPRLVRELMGDRSARIWIYEGGNKPPNMPHEAPGMNPSRWERE